MTFDFKVGLRLHISALLVSKIMKINDWYKALATYATTKKCNQKICLHTPIASNNLGYPDPKNWPTVRVGESFRGSESLFFEDM